MRTFRPKLKPQKQQNRKELVKFLRGQGYGEALLATMTTRQLRCMRARFVPETGLRIQGKLNKL